MEFQGFQSSFSPAIIALLLVVLVIIALFSYQKQKSLTLPARWLLGALRAITFIILALLLFNPVFFKSEVVERAPKLMVLLDNSESTGINKGEYQGLNPILAY